MKFKKEELIALAEDSHNPDNFTVVERTIEEVSRWSVLHGMVFKHGDKFYSTGYSVGATEYQDESPYEYEGDYIECEEVIPTQITITKYIPVPKGKSK